MTFPKLPNGRLLCVYCALVAATLSLSLFGAKDKPVRKICPIGKMANRASRPTEPTTIAEWKALPPEVRQDKLEILIDNLDMAKEGRSEKDGNKFTVVKLNSWNDVVYDPFGKKILAAFKNAGIELPDTEVDQIRVGSPKGKVRVVRLADGTPIGGMVTMLQEGAQRSEPTGESHEDVATWQKAKAAGFEDNDVSWTLSLRFDEKGELVPAQDTYWDWSGH